VALVMRNRGDAVVPGERVAVVDEAKIVELRKSGLTHKAIATRYRMSLVRVGRILRKHGLAPRQGDKEL
jgi:hypothetical protein